MPLLAVALVPSTVAEQPLDPARCRWMPVTVPRVIPPAVVKVTALKNQGVAAGVTVNVMVPTVQVWKVIAGILASRGPGRPVPVLKVPLMRELTQLIAVLVVVSVITVAPAVPEKAPPGVTV